MNIPSLDQVQKTISKKNYQFLDDGQPYHLNIIGIRSSSTVVNRFDDLLTVIYRDAEGIHYIYMDCTTKPGLYYLDHPDNVNGVAILAPGQYTDLFTKGMHKGQYPCLIQDGTLRVFRDNKRDGGFDYTNIFPAPRECGLEIHHANASFASIEVDNWSAGCQVVANPASFQKLMDLVDRSEHIRGSKFTYTLLNEDDL